MFYREIHIHLSESIANWLEILANGNKIKVKSGERIIFKSQQGEPSREVVVQDSMAVLKSLTNNLGSLWQAT